MSPARIAEVRQAKRLLESLWLWIFVAAFAAAAVPWFARALEVDLAGLAATLFAAAAAMFVVGRLGDRLRGRALVTATVLPHFAGIVVLGWAWLQAGGLGYPLYLLVFALPVAASAIGPVRAQAIWTSLLAVGVGSYGAWCQSPDLRWYCLQLGLPLEWAAGWIVPAFAAAGLPGGELTAAFHFSTVAAFATLLPALAVGIEAVAWRNARDRRLAAAGSGRDVLRDALASSPTPTVLVLADDGRIAAANPAFQQQMLLDADPAGSSVFDHLRVEEPLLASLLAAGGDATAAYRVGAEDRTARLQAHGFEHDGERFSLLRVEDAGERKSPTEE